MKAQIYDLIYIFIEKVYINQGNRLKSFVSLEHRFELNANVVKTSIISIIHFNSILIIKRISMIDSF